MSSLVRSHRHGRSLQLTLDDASSKNALSLAAAREVRDIILKKDFESLLLLGAGRVFCSGGQLADYAQMTDANQGRAVNDEIREILAELSVLDRPTIACVGGDAFGGGVELLSCFDVVIAAPHVMFSLWQRKIGLSFGWGGGGRIEKRIGPSQLRRLSLTTQSVSSREALALGLVDLVVQEPRLLETAVALAARMAALPHEPFAILKNFEASTEANSFNSIWWNESHRKNLASRKH